MGLNDDQLSAAEHADVRARLLAGTKRIKPAGAHRRAIVTTTVSVAIVAVLSVGAIGAANFLRGGDPSEPIATPSATPTSTPTTTRSPSPTATATPSSTPTAPSAPTIGTTAFADDCANALTNAEVSTSIQDEVVLRVPPWTSGEEALRGGISCTWTTPDAYQEATVYLSAYPASIVPPDVLNEPVMCAPDSYLCTVSRVVDGTWLWVSTSPNFGQNVAEALLSTAASRVSNYPAPRAVAATPSWWTDVSCADLFASIDLAAIAGFSNVVDNSVGNDDFAGPGAIPSAVGGVRYCMFSGDIDAGSYLDVSIVIVPGGGGYFSQIAASDGAEPVEVQGATAATAVQDDDLFEGHFPPVVATDGPNLVAVGINSAAPQHEALRASIASAVLAALG